MGQPSCPSRADGAHTGRGPSAPVGPRSRAAASSKPCSTGSGRDDLPWAARRRTTRRHRRLFGPTPNSGSPSRQLHCGLGSPDPERVREVREQATGRVYRTDALLQVIRLGADPDIAAEKLAAEWGHISAEQLLDTPFVLLARDGSQAAEILAQRGDEFGFDSFTTHEPNLEALGQAIAAA